MRDVLTIIAAAAVTLGMPSAALADASHPTVVELYQSQGCPPPAGDRQYQNAIVGAALVRGLPRPTFAVTYWDQLGWKDTFARPEFTRRQWDFAHGQGARRCRYSANHHSLPGR